ncbi:hypothetical protein EV421DRAFT_2026821 [Armillaria borealis]|uniref:Uncharacterized protein n=1 Tax=Armillaria borealis TaxID=47425 RepID=A0AA39IER1_9AGAR|nr:hypothetical protein EV421DRAFT_2026821 [Armillaria borealis]
METMTKSYSRMSQWGNVWGWSLKVSVADVLTELSGSSQPYHGNVTSLWQRISTRFTGPTLARSKSSDLVLFGFFSSLLVTNHLGHCLNKAQLSALAVSLLPFQYGRTHRPLVLPFHKTPSCSAEYILPGDYKQFFHGRLIDRRMPSMRNVVGLLLFVCTERQTNVVGFEISEQRRRGAEATAYDYWPKVQKDRNRCFANGFHHAKGGLLFFSRSELICTKRGGNKVQEI